MHLISAVGGEQLRSTVQRFLAHVSMTLEQGGRNSDTFYLFILKDVYGNLFICFSLYISFFVVTIIEVFTVLYSGCLCILLL